MDDRPAEKLEVKAPEFAVQGSTGETGAGTIAVPEKPPETPEEVKTPDGAGQDDEEDAQSALKEWVELLMRAGIWALLIYVFLFQISIVDGRSMEKTFFHGDRLLIDKLTYRLGDIRRYDVVVFEAMDSRSSPRVPKDYIKRVIGLPGETVEIQDGAVFVNGQKIEDSFGPTYANRLRDPAYRSVFVVPPRQYFVMGDNREDSKDSRIDETTFMGRETLGFVARRQIRGLVRLRFWPWKDWTWYGRK
ncbi:MAG TPA: signal peptidase I [Planctomycetota bacterium]|nr:signal peptidase I [Planctomycetota bacterium]